MPRLVSAFAPCRGRPSPATRCLALHARRVLFGIDDLITATPTTTSDRDAQCRRRCGGRSSSRCCARVAFALGGDDLPMHFDVRPDRVASTNEAARSKSSLRHRLAGIGQLGGRDAAAWPWRCRPTARPLLGTRTRRGNRFDSRPIASGGLQIVPRRGSRARCFPNAIGIGGSPLENPARWRSDLPARSTWPSGRCRAVRRYARSAEFRCARRRTGNSSRSCRCAAACPR